jgi:sulfate adenylyltransferase subunit 2
MYQAPRRIRRQGARLQAARARQRGRVAKQGINPITHGSKVHTDIMKTQALRQALDKYRFDAAFGGARRDEEKSRAKERVFSFRDEFHRWDPKNQRPELWNLYNTKVKKGESIRVVSALQLDRTRRLAIHPSRKHPNRAALLREGAADRRRDGVMIMVDDERLPLEPGEAPEMRRVRFRTLGCYPLSRRRRLRRPPRCPRSSRRCCSRRSPNGKGRLIDSDEAGSMERKKKEGYF